MLPVESCGGRAGERRRGGGLGAGEGADGRLVVERKRRQRGRQLQRRRNLGRETEMEEHSKQSNTGMKASHSYLSFL